MYHPKNTVCSLENCISSWNFDTLIFASEMNYLYWHNLDEASIKFFSCSIYNPKTNFKNCISYDTLLTHKVLFVSCADTFNSKTIWFTYLFLDWFWCWPVFCYLVWCIWSIRVCVYMHVQELADRDRPVNFNLCAHIAMMINLLRSNKRRKK